MHKLQRSATCATPKVVGKVDDDGRAVTSEVVMQPDGTERTVDVSSRAYEKLQIPAFPKYGDAKNWLTQLGRNAVAAAPYMDWVELKWLKECYTKSFEELRDSGAARMKRLDVIMSTRLAPVIHKSGESLSEDLFLADR